MGLKLKLLGLAALVSVSAAIGSCGTLKYLERNRTMAGLPETVTSKNGERFTLYRTTRFSGTKELRFYLDSNGDLAQVSGIDSEGRPFREIAGEYTKDWNQEFAVARCIGINKPINYCRIPIIAKP